MGYQEINIKMACAYSDEELKNRIREELKLSEFIYQILGKSLDARNKNAIHWQLRLAVVSKQIQGELPAKKTLEIPKCRSAKKALVVGSGPAGIFSALVLQQAGIKTTLIERGADVDKREKGIQLFEQSGIFNPICNYTFGEGGAGTFSDGKLTSRSKRISLEKQFILENYVKAGAPDEILFLTHPHLGTDNLKIITKNLRENFQELGGTILFETMLDDIKINKSYIDSVSTSAGILEADYFVLATGHSAVETYKMMIRRGIPFRTKNFALGARMEHRQEVVNQAQWGVKKLPGVKAAEYRLTSNRNGRLPVFTFCMCPGGMIVPATPYESLNIVNGMSYYKRDGQFANAACVAGIHPDELLGKETSPLEMLDWLQNLEEQFFEYSRSYKSPICSIPDFLQRSSSNKSKESSYPLGLVEAPLWEMLPQKIVASMQEGLLDFSRKMKGFETGNLLGLESKTSSPVQVVREQNGQVSGFENLYIVGEGSGYAGGIISSAADGIKAAMHIVGSC